MIDTEWLKKNVTGCLDSIKSRDTLTAEEQGLVNVLDMTLGMIEEQEFLKSAETKGRILGGLKMAIEKNSWTVNKATDVTILPKDFAIEIFNYLKG